MNRQGYSIMEAVVAMTIFALGTLALTQSFFGITRAQVNARNQELATRCAGDRIEEIVNSMSYTAISEATYPDESAGEVNDGESLYEHFSRDVTIADSLNAINQSVLKEVTVTVAWQSSLGQRDVTLNTVIARYKDIQP